jgi:DegV family protein with EDD domain
MTENLYASLAAGYTTLAARTELLDAINVFPVADGDTGANLRASLAPLAGHAGDKTGLAAALLRSACGNSGNIAAAFFSEFAQAQGADLAIRAESGARQARRAVAEPKAGTMLDIFATLPELLRKNSLDAACCPALLASLAEKVRQGTALLPELRAAGVADAGAVAMYIFFAGFFRHLTGDASDETPLAATFAGLLAVADDYTPAPASGFCVDVLLETTGGQPAPESLAGLGDSLVMLPEANALKLHVHSDNPAALRARLGGMGRIVSWSDSPLATGGDDASSSGLRPVRVITDAAGSLSRHLAAQENITLLDSLIVIDGKAYSETEVVPAELYRRMRGGGKVGTAQAARAEREEMLAALCEEGGHFLYLAVGSAYTGNYLAAADWQRTNPLGALLTVIDSGAASGRLAVIALLAARYAGRGAAAGEKPENIARYAERCRESCREFLFIDTLSFLAAGGRISKTGEFLGTFFGLKPIISPMPTGVRKLGVVRSRDGQLAFLKARLAGAKEPGQSLVLLQYTDNKDWLAETLPPVICSLLPEAEIHILPLSLTTGAHVGPGSWSVAVGYQPPH